MRMPLSAWAAMVLLIAARSSAGSDPTAAPKIRGSFVTAYEACTSPNARGPQSFGGDLVGCTPPVRSDPVCGFGPNGSGRFSLTVRKRGLHVAAKLVGLDAGCEGTTLRLAVAARATTAACSPGSCTLEDDESATIVPAGPCLVSDGVCSLGGFFPFADLPREEIRLSVGDVFVYREGLRAFTSGISIPPGRRDP